MERVRLLGSNGEIRWLIFNEGGLREEDKEEGDHYFSIRGFLNCKSGRGGGNWRSGFGELSQGTGVIGIFGLKG
jgi:hypothetical protein